MTEPRDIPSLDAPPDAGVISELRERATTQDESIGVTFPTSNDDTKRFVVSPRGTCVLLANTREETFNQSVSAEDIASALRE